MNLEAKIYHKFIGKNPQQYTNKFNSPAYTKNYIPHTSEIYFRNVKLIHYLKLNKYNLPYQQNKEAKSQDYINRCRKIFGKFVIYS